MSPARNRPARLGAVNGVKLPINVSLLQLIDQDHRGIPEEREVSSRHPPEILRKLPGYDRDVHKNRGEAREIMHQLGYGPDNRLKVKVSDPSGGTVRC
jgi:hypothetical protein